MPKLYIEVLGGVVTNVYSNAAIEVVLIDHDNIEENQFLLAEFEADKNNSGFAELVIT